MKKSRLWLGLSGVTSALLTLVLSGTVLANANAMLINDALGISTSGLIVIYSLIRRRARQRLRISIGMMPTRILSL